jgi:hypothetical protein
MPVHKMKFVLVNNMAPRQALYLHGMFATAGTELLA